MIQSGRHARARHHAPRMTTATFTVLDSAPGELIDQFRRLLFDMSYTADSAVRALLDLEGLKQWRSRAAPKATPS